MKVSCYPTLALVAPYDVCFLEQSYALGAAKVAIALEWVYANLFGVGYFIAVAVA